MPVMLYRIAIGHWNTVVLHGTERAPGGKGNTGLFDLAIVAGVTGKLDHGCPLGLASRALEKQLMGRIPLRHDLGLANGTTVDSICRRNLRH